MVMGVEKPVMKDSRLGKQVAKLIKLNPQIQPWSHVPLSKIATDAIYKSTAVVSVVSTKNLEGTICTLTLSQSHHDFLVIVCSNIYV